MLLNMTFFKYMATMSSPFFALQNIIFNIYVVCYIQSVAYAMIEIHFVTNIYHCFFNIAFVFLLLIVIYKLHNLSCDIFLYTFMIVFFFEDLLKRNCDKQNKNANTTSDAFFSLKENTLIWFRVVSHHLYNEIHNHYQFTSCSVSNSSKV